MFLSDYSENSNKRSYVTFITGSIVVGLTAITPPSLEWIWPYVAVTSLSIAALIFGVIIYVDRKWKSEERKLNNVT